MIENLPVIARHDGFPPATMAFPGPRAAMLIDELNRYVITDPWPFVVDLERCRGLTLATIDGQLLQDWSGVYGSRLLGYNHPRLQEPAYLARLALVANNKLGNPDYLTVECLDYYRLLRRLTPACLSGNPVEVYAVNSGAEAVENMLKYLINLHDRRHGPAGKQAPHRFIRFEGAFHGRTVFALSLTGLAHAPLITRDFHGLFPFAESVPFPAYDPEADAAANQAVADASLAAITAILEAHPGEVVGIVAEILQGAGGQRIAVPGFWPRLSELVHRHGTFLAFDEVQTAGGQCGAIFACDLLGLPHPPQAIAVAKKFGCGAVYMRHPMEDEGVLDSTWGGNLCDMVRVVQEFRVVEEEHLLERAAERSLRLVAGLEDLARRHPARIGKVRGLGLYQGFSLRDRASTADFITAARDLAGLFLLSAGPGQIRLRPPLDVGDADIARLLAGLDQACRSLG